MIRIGIVGAGNIARTHARAFEQIANATVVAVADIKPEAADTMAARFQARAYNDMYRLAADPNVDAIDICLPTHIHEEAVLVAAQAGKHILCEKPIGLSLEQVDRMIQAVERAGVKAMVAQVIRFWPHYLAIKDLLERGALGRPLMASAARLGRLARWTSWYADPRLSGGALLDLHIHDLDWLFYLFGKPKTVYSVGVQAQSGAWNELATALDFGDRKAVVEASLMMPDSYPFTMIFRLLGDEGHAEYQYGGGQSDPQAAARLHRLVLYRNGEQPRIPPCDEIDPYLAEIRYFVDCLDKGQTPAIATLAEARTVLGIALAARQSLETGSVVDIEQS